MPEILPEIAPEMSAGSVPDILPANLAPDLRADISVVVLEFNSDIIVSNLTLTDPEMGREYSAAEDDARVRILMANNGNWEAVMEEGLGEHRDVLLHFGMTLADVAVETRVAKRRRIE